MTMSMEVEEFAAQAKSYREFVESARRASRMLDRRRAGVLHNLDVSKQKFAAFLREKRLEEGCLKPTREAADSGDESSSSSSSVSPSRPRSSTIPPPALLVGHNGNGGDIDTGDDNDDDDDDSDSEGGSLFANKRAAHLVQQQQTVSGVAVGQSMELMLLPIYDVDLYLHFNKKKRKHLKNLYPYLTRLVNSINDREYLRIYPLLSNAGYANNSLWSKKSIQLEYSLRPFLLPTAKSIASTAAGNNITNAHNNSLVAKYVHETLLLLNILPVKADVSIVDTIWSDQTSNPNREFTQRLTSSEGTAQSQARELGKVH
jgi:hypothetical protein